MFKLYVFSSYLCCFMSVVYADSMIGPGKWKLLNIEKKESDLNRFDFDIVQRKFNRTHDIFQGSLTFREELNQFYGARVEVCKHVDGGCKQYQLITDDSFEGLVGKYAESNFKAMLSSAGCEDPKFPVPEGKYEIEQYLWDWDSLPDECPYGEYTAESCVMEKTLTAGCVVVQIAFQEDEDDEE